MTWRSLCAEAPWIDRSPADITRDRIRLTPQPFVGPPNTPGLDSLLNQVQSEDMLSSASDHRGGNPRRRDFPVSIEDNCVVIDT